MRILVISQYYYPERFLINEITAELVKRGNQVTVLTGLPNYPEGIISDKYKNGKNRNELINGVNVIRCPIIARGHNKIRLLLNYFSYMISASIKVNTLKENFDFIFLYQLTPIFQAFPAVKYSKRHKIPLVCYCCDLAPASGSQLLSGLKILMTPYTKFAKWAYSSCDRVVVTSKSFINYLNEMHDIPFEKMTYIPQHASEILLNENLEKKANGMIEFMFAGNIGAGANLDMLVEACDKLYAENLPFRFHFVGEGTAKDYLKKLVHSKNLDDVIVFHKGVSFDRMPEMYRMADVLYVSLRKGQITVPSKLQAYMATGKPVLGSMDGSGYEMIKESECGLCVKAGDVEGLISAMRKMINEFNRFNDAGIKGRKYFYLHFRLSTYMDSLVELFNMTVKE